MPKPVYKTKAEMRAAFNQEDFEAKRKAGQVSYRHEREPHPAPSHLGFPGGTKSEYIAVIGGNGKKLAVFHRYLLPDGRIGASGKNDPKRLLVGDELWLVDPNDTSN